MIDQWLIIPVGSLLTVPAVAAPISPPIELVMSLFDLTPAEARVACGRRPSSVRETQRRIAPKSSGPSSELMMSLALIAIAYPQTFTGRFFELFFLMLAFVFPGTLRRMLLSLVCMRNWKLLPRHQRLLETISSVERRPLCKLLHILPLLNCDCRWNRINGIDHIVANPWVLVWR